MSAVFPFLTIKGSKDRFKKGVSDVKNAFSAPSLSLPQRASKFYTGLAGVGTGGLLNEMNIGERVSNAFAPRAKAAGPAPTASTSYANVPPEVANPDAFSADLGGDGTPVDDSSAAGAAGASPTAYEPQIRFIPGDPRPYDISDPAQRSAYFNARLQFAQEMQTRELGNLDQNYQRGLTSARSKYEGDNATLEERIAALNDQEANYAMDYDKRVSGFGSDYTGASARRSNAYAASAPNAFQSAQGNDERYAYDKYKEGINDFGQELSMNKAGFGRDRAAIDRSRKNLKDTYDSYLADQDSTYRTKRGELETSVNAFKQNEAADLAPFDASQGFTDLGDRYQLEGYDPYQTSKVDTSKYTAATSFNGLPGMDSASQNNAFSLMAPKRSSLDEYLDKSKDSRNKNPMRQYLYA